MRNQIHVVLISIAIAAIASCPPRSRAQECTRDCLVEIEGLQTQYRPHSQVKITLRNKSHELLLVNVAEEGYVNGQWVEIVASVTDPNHPFERMVKAIPLKTGSSYALSFNPWATVEGRTKAAPLDDKPTEFRLRISIHEKGKIAQQMTSASFRLVQEERSD